MQLLGDPAWRHRRLRPQFLGGLSRKITDVSIAYDNLTNGPLFRETLSRQEVLQLVNHRPSEKEAADTILAPC